MKRVLAFFPFFVWLSGCAIFPPTVELPGKLNSIEGIESYLQKAVDQEQPPSITLAVVKGDASLYSKSFGYADGPKKKAATSQTVYQWWSLTKLFTAIAILQLEEKGLLSLEDSVSKHLPFFQARDLNGKNQTITVRQLLSHSSGLGDIGMEILGWIHFDGDSAVSQTDLLKKTHLKYGKLVVKPGCEGRYSNFGYLVLAGIIEAVTGKTYEATIVENILRPLKMKHTDFVYTEAMRPFEAAGSHPKDLLSYVVPIYLDTKKAVREESRNTLWFNRVYSDQKGATGLIGSAEDMMRFMKALLRNGELDGVRILSAANVGKMMTPVVKVHESPAPDSTGLDFGLAWFIGRSDGTITLTHGGSGMAFVTTLRLYPERDLGIVVFANSTYLGNTMGTDIVNLVGNLKW